MESQSRGKIQIDTGNVAVVAQKVRCWSRNKVSIYTLGYELKPPYMIEENHS